MKRATSTTSRRTARQAGCSPTRLVATSGDPNGKGLPRWTAYNETDEPYLDLGDTVAIKHHLLKAQLDFIDEAQLRRRATSQP